MRFALPEGGAVLSGSEGSDQGYESDQSRVRRYLGFHLLLDILRYCPGTGLGLIM